MYVVTIFYVGCVRGINPALAGFFLGETYGIV